MATDPATVGLAAVGSNPASGSVSPGIGAAEGLGSSARADSIQRFNVAMQKAEMSSPTVASNPALNTVMRPFEQLSSEAAQLTKFADQISKSSGTLAPKDLVMLTVRAQEFMFHCQLTSNVANRTSDGLQQLFRQQS
jgi:hypothetical protein